MEAEAFTRDQPLDDEPALGDEQSGGLQPVRVGDVTVVRDARVVRVTDLDDHAA